MAVPLTLREPIMTRTPTPNPRKQIRKWVSSEPVQTWLAPLATWFALMVLALLLGAWYAQSLSPTPKQATWMDWSMVMVVVLISTVLCLAIWRLLRINRKELRHIHRLSQFNALLAQINQTIAQTPDETRLLQRSCDLAVELAHLKLAWIGKPDSEGTIQFLASAGEQKYLDGIFISIREDLPEGHGPTGQCWRVKLPVFGSSKEDVDRLSPWSGPSKRFGLRSCAALPIYRNTQPWAVLAVYHEENGVFETDLQEILEELARDVGYGLDYIDLLSRERAAVAMNESLLNNTTAGMALVSYPDRVIVKANQRLADLWGYSRASDFVGQSIQTLLGDNHVIRKKTGALYQTVLTQGQAEARDVPYLRADGTTIYMDLTAGRIDRDMADRIIMTWTVVDVTERHQLAKNWIRQALADPLTELANRRALDDEMEHAIARAHRHHSTLVVCMLDLDGFKEINDIYGHETGDQVLKATARRLEKIMRKSDFIARIGGDEFVLLIEGETSPPELEVIFGAIESVISEPIILSNHATVTLGVSMGVCLYPSAEVAGSDTLLRYADRALYESKAHKSDRLRYWVQHGEAVPRRSNTHQLLLKQGGVEVFYQPILDTRHKKIVAIEALARLRSSDSHIIYPKEFLPQITADDTTDLSRLVLTQALADLKVLDDKGWFLDVSFNLSPQSFATHCVSWLSDVIERSGIDPSRITAEILESDDFLERDSALVALHAIRKIGIRLALDDVGSAYSSLLRLKELPVDKVKLDQGFVRTLEKYPQDLHFVRAIQDLATELKVDLVVEGVETEDVLDAMLTMGVQYLQGHVISQPLPLRALEDFLAHFELSPVELPTTLFGFYASTMVSHGTRKKMIMINPAELNLETLPDGRRCREHEIMRRFGYGDESDLVRSHNLYHQALGAVIDLDMRSRSDSDWEAMEEAFSSFTQSILVEWGSEPHNHKPKIA